MNSEYLQTVEQYLRSVGALDELFLGENNVTEVATNRRHSSRRSPAVRDEAIARRELVGRLEKSLTRGRRIVQGVIAGYAVIFLGLLCFSYATQSVAAASVTAIAVFGGAMAVLRALRETWKASTVMELLVSLSSDVSPDTMAHVLGSMYFNELRRGKPRSKAIDDGSS